MRNIIITKKETMSNILRFSSNQAIDKAKKMVINFEDEEIALVDESNSVFAELPLSSLYIEFIEELLNS